MNKHIEVGDLVQLKSGGPKMTVLKIGQHLDGCYVDCIWFSVDTSSFSTMRFPLDCIQLS